MKPTVLVVAAALALAACKKSEPDAQHRPEPAVVPAPAPPAAPAATPAPGPGDCSTLSGANAVLTEMRRLECALQHAIVALGRDDLAAIPRWIHVVHEARLATEQALASGAYRPRGDAAAFTAIDAAFHTELEQLVMAALAKDHAGAAAALGRALGACQGCHATFRPAGAAAPAAPGPAAPPAEHHGH